jgi:transposase
VLIQDLIEKRLGGVYHPHYVAELLKTMGFSYQKGRFESDLDLRKDHTNRRRSELLTKIIG